MMDNNSVTIEEMLPIQATGKIILQAFTGSGLVASLVSHHLIEKFKLQEKGYVKSKFIPSIGIVRNGVIQRPVRVFENKDYLLILSEVGIPQDNLNEFMEGLFDWYLKVDPAQIIIVGALPTGRPVEAEDLRYSLVSSDDQTRNFLESKGLRISHRSAVYGSVALSLLEANRCNISAMAILPHCIASIPDYLATKKVIELLSEILDISIPIHPLDENAIELKQHLIRRKKDKSKSIDMDDEDDEFDDYESFIEDMLDATDDEDDDEFDPSKFK